MTIHFQRALLPDGWRNDVRLTIDADEQVERVETGVEAAAVDERGMVGLAGIPNVHSHAFQRGMAGLAEARGQGEDTFWTWRELMYRFLDRMTPEDVEAITGMAFMEMLESGFTTVGEFHYLHHDRDGQPFADIAEMSGRVAAAAASTGIRLVLLPVFFAHSDFGGEPPTEGQRRFVCDLESFARLLDGARRAVADLPGAEVGIAPHSLRAVTPDELEALVTMASSGPIHIHVAEQVKEVEDCIDWSGKRPVEWLLDNAPVDHRWCAIHATHMTPSEVRGLAQSGAVTGLCPVTEANLGDGIFATADWARAGGRYGVGTDSNVRIGLADELRQLEYGQRLTTRTRNVLAASGRSTGRSLYDAALAGGTAALGLDRGGLSAGSVADIVALNVEPPLLELGEGDALLDTWIIAGRARVNSVWCGGKRLVDGGRHRSHEAVEQRFHQAMRRLLAA